MPKPKNPDPRPLPRLILLSLPEQTSRARLGPPRARLRSEVELKPDVPDPYIRAMHSSMDELRALITLVQSFLNSKEEGVTEAAKWLKELLDELADIDINIANGNFDGKVTIDDVSALDEILINIPDLGEFLDESADIFPWNMLKFWLIEVGNRGRGLVDIAIQKP